MKIFKKLLVIALLFLVIIGLSTFWCNFKIDSETEDSVTSNLSKLPSEKVGLLLGTSKNLSNGRPNAYFYNRIKAATEL